MNLEDKNFDHFDLLSKEQIIAYLKKNHSLNAPALFDVKWFSWECENRENQIQMDAYCKESMDQVYEDLILAREKMIEADNPGDYKKWERKVAKIRKQLSDREKLWEKLKSERERLTKVSEELLAYQDSR